MTQGLSTDDIAGRPGASEAEPAPPADPELQESADPEPREPAELPLLDEAEAAAFLDRWRDVQSRFVDDPQGAVRDGDGLVAELMQALARRFSERKGDLEEQWNRGGEPETEDLRIALQQYRTFFQRLLDT